MSTGCPTLWRILYSLRDRSYRRTAGFEAMEFDCPCRDWLALRNSDLTDKRLAAGRRHLVPSRAAARALAGNNGIGGGSPFRAVPVDSWVGVSAGVNLLRCLYLGKYRKYYSLQYFGVLYHTLFASVVLILIPTMPFHSSSPGRSCRSRAISS